MKIILLIIPFFIMGCFDSEMLSLEKEIHGLAIQCAEFGYHSHEAGRSKQETIDKIEEILNRNNIKGD